MYNYGQINLARERPLRAARNGHGASLGHAFLKTFISGFSSGQQFKPCSLVHSQMRFQLLVELLLLNHESKTKDLLFFVIPSVSRANTINMNALLLLSMVFP
jgi:hypothetical protein